MNYKQFINIKNNKIIENYKEDIKKIVSFKSKIKNKKDNYSNYFGQIINKILYYNDIYHKISENGFEKFSLEKLEKINSEIVKEIQPDNYGESFANPEYACQIFGDNLGTLFSFYFSTFINLRKNSFTGKLYHNYKYIHNFIKILDEWENNNFDFNNLMTKIIKEQNEAEVTDSLKLNYDPDLDLNYDIVVNSNLNDLRYLYKYGKNISDNEKKIAKFLNNYDEIKIEKLSESILKSYVRGITNANKNMNVRKNILFIYNIGQEKIVRSIIRKMEKMNFRPILSRVESTAVNKQFLFDHKFDNSLYLDENYVEKFIYTMSKAAKNISNLLELYSGVLFIEKFGETNFSPEKNEKAATLTSKQRSLFQKLKMKQTQIIEKYRPRSETTFCIVAFPVPEIGDNFVKIFEDIIEINMLDTDYYEKIQQNLVDVLDKADYVKVLGKDGNKTNVAVKMQKLSNPSKQTNFFNCGADVNIPVGEVFTSPQLKGTTGILHVKTAFLNGLEFKNLEIEFEDGFVKKYNCSNFSTDEENKKYIKDNLLFPHETLPLGEFAIGTNTLAYKMAKKYKILPLLPILIVEKMGPHFAIGDTCYTWEEDEFITNPIDKKEIVAKDNEKSILRKKDINLAYTNCHTDITLPYEDLERITVVTYDKKEIDIIKDGRFVVPGTEILNEPLIEMEGWS